MTQLYVLSFPLTLHRHKKHKKRICLLPFLIKCMLLLREQFYQQHKVLVYFECRMLSLLHQIRKFRENLFQRSRFAVIRYQLISLGYLELFQERVWYLPFTILGPPLVIRDGFCTHKFPVISLPKFISDCSWWRKHQSSLRIWKLGKRWHMIIQVFGMYLYFEH